MSPDRDLPMHLLPFAIASFLGPLTLGRLFDKIGRKPMITACYGAAGLLLASTLFPFVHGTFGARELGIMFSVIFFIASSAASAVSHVAAVLDIEFEPFVVEEYRHPALP